MKDSTESIVNLQRFHCSPLFKTAQCCTGSVCGFVWPCLTVSCLLSVIQEEEEEESQDRTDPSRVSAAS